MADTTENCDDNDIGVLMPNVVKLLRDEINSEGSEGSKSMSISSEGEKENHLVQSKRPMNTHEATSRGQPQGETLIQEVAKRFRREGASGRGCLSLSKPLDLAPFRFHSSSRRPGTSHLPTNSIPKKNEMVMAPAATKIRTRLTIEEKMAMKQIPQAKSSKDLAQGTLRTKLKLKHSLAANSKTKAGRTTLPKTSLSGHGHDNGYHVLCLAGARPWRRPKILPKPIPIDMSELQKIFAQIDEETLEEEQESSIHVRLQYSTVVTQMSAHEAKVNGVAEVFEKVCSEIQGDLKESSEHTKNKAYKIPRYSQAQLLKEPEISNGKTTLRKTDGNASRTPPRAGSEERSVLEESNSNTNPDSKTEHGSEEHQSRPNHVEVLHSEGERILHEYDGNSRDVGVSEDVEVSLNEIIGVDPNLEKRCFRDSAGLVITCEEVSLSQCSGKTGARKLLVTTTKMGSPPARVPRVPLPEQFGMASDTEPGNRLTSALLKDQSRRVSVNPTPQKRLSLSEAENLSTTNNPPERTCSTPSPQDVDHGPSTSGNEVPGSKKPHVNACGHDSALKKDPQHGHHSQPLRKNHPLEVSNIGGGTYEVDMESSSSPTLKPLSNLGYRYSRRGKSVETSQRRLAFVSDTSTSDKDDGLENTEIHGSGRKFASDQQAEERNDSKCPLIGKDEGYRVDFSNPAQVSGEHSDTVEGMNVGAGSGCNAPLDDMSCPETQWINTLPSIEEALVKPTRVEQTIPLMDHTVDDKENCDSRPVDDSRKVHRKKRGRTVNFGSPIDAGTRWREGRRISTRIKSKPLDWWRGEKMMYGRVHSTLCTLIGIKTMSPDPIWPKPKPNRGDNKVHKFYIDSFVDDKYTDLLRLAAQ